MGGPVDPLVAPLELSLFKSGHADQPKAELREQHEAEIESLRWQAAQRWPLRRLSFDRKALLK